MLLIDYDFFFLETTKTCRKKDFDMWRWQIQNLLESSGMSAPWNKHKLLESVLRLPLHAALDAGNCAAVEDCLAELEDVLGNAAAAEIYTHSFGRRLFKRSPQDIYVD